MAESTEAKRNADASKQLRLVARVADLDKLAPFGWKIYEVKGWNLAQALRYEPVVVATHGGPSSQCFGTPPPPKSTRDPVLAAWECSAAPWWRNGDLNRPFAADGPAQWARAASAAAAQKVTPRPLPKVKVGPVNEGVDQISFHVSQVGVPIVVKTSYFPNWQAHGARGPWRLAPNLMVVVPTSHDVRLTYGETTGDKAGRVLTLVGVLGVAALARYRPAADPEPEPVTGSRPPPTPEAVDPPESTELPDSPEPSPEPEPDGEPEEPDGEPEQPAEVPALP
jgi:hypothetical protein